MTITKAKLISLIAGIVCMSLLAVSMHSAADISYTTNCPSAWNAAGVYGYCWYATQRGGDYALLDAENASQWVATGAFVNPNYESDWTPQTLPPDNATITAVYLYARVKLGGEPLWDMRWIRVGFSPNWNGYGETSWTESPNYLVTWDIWGAYTWNVTSQAYWTPTLIKSWNLWVRLYAYSVSHYAPLHVDYVGLYYNWTVTTEAEDPEEGSDLSQLMPSVPGMLGAIGFFGLIAFPAVAVWMYRRNPEQSKLVIFVNLVIVMMFCFVLLLGSLGS